ncbi:M16 family metallopeptidase [Kitasatospora sp. NPDC101801]|uniref:M16 family metallopeptidase n=1 Tax=Kitasatospora sp. NPDC101801 TaxID=3364103 RepID=UPI0037F65247
MHRDQIDGVPVLWAEAPGPLEAVLLFGCGASDETFRTLGVTHLVEHLAMSTLPRLHHDHNASVDLNLTQFTATGRPEQVVEFLAKVCEALGALPLDRIEREAGVLAAENGAVTDPTTAELLSSRFGTQGPGLASFPGPGPDRIPVEAVRDLVTRYFHADNAVLVLTGPPPAGLRLPLPAGERPDRSAAHPVRQTGPSWQQADVPGPGLALSCDLDDPALHLALNLLRQRLTELVRHQHGLSYDVGGDVAHAGPAWGERVICLDAREGQEQRVAELLWQEALRLATENASEAELAEEVEGAREVFEDPRSVVYELGEAAGEFLLGGTYRPAADRLDAMRRVTPDALRTAFAAALESALLVVPLDTEVALRLPDGAELARYRCTDAAELPRGGQEFRPSLKDRLRYPAARRTRLVVTGDGLWSSQSDGSVHHLPFTDVVGVEQRGPGRMVFGRGNCWMPVLPDVFHGIAPAVRAIDAAVPAALCYPASDFNSED